MKLYTILRNIIQGIKNAVAHSDENLQTGVTYRKLDWANATKPVPSGQRSTWTFTAQEDGELLIAFFSGPRTYIGMFVNDNRIFDFAVNQGSYTSAIPVTIILSKGDVLKVADLNNNTFVGSETLFIPFKNVGGVILNLLNNRRVVLA